MARYRTTLMLVVAFLVMLATLFLLQQPGIGPATVQTVVPTPIVLYRFNPDDVERLELEQAGKRTIFAKNAQGSWVSQNAPDQTVQQNVISNLIPQLGNLTAQRVITDPQAVANPAQYGLDGGAMQVNLVLKDGTAQRFLLGDRVRVEPSYYLKKESETTIYTVTNSAVGGLFNLVNPVSTPARTPTTGR